MSDTGPWTNSGKQLVNVDLYQLLGSRAALRLLWRGGSWRKAEAPPPGAIAGDLNEEDQKKVKHVNLNISYMYFHMFGS